MSKHLILKGGILIIAVLLLTAFSLNAQRHNYLYFSGNISSAITWNRYDTVYITGNITVSSGGSLTITPNIAGSNAGRDIGVFIVFRGSCGITVSGSGALNITGSPADSIHFTADFDRDHRFGEAGERWQNILFNSNTGSSSINYSSVEYGTGTTALAGGGLSIICDNITVSNSSIRKNSLASGTGGGIYASGSGIVFRNIRVNNNTAPSGAGLYLASGTTLSGCLISDNTGTGVYNAGTGSYLSNCLLTGNNTGMIADGPAVVVNCNFVNNLTGFINSSVLTSRIVNTVIWGNTVEYTVTDGSSLEISNSAIEGGLSGGTDGGNNIVLSSVNNASNGPNFINQISDYHLGSGVSPLIDGGASSVGGITIPSTDSDNRQRIGKTDIGAYEFLYYLWEGDVSTSWTNPGNWAGWHTVIPETISENRVEIPSGTIYYPTATNLTLSSRSTLSIKPGAGLTITRNTTVNSGCAFLIESDETGTGNFITGSRLTGSFQTELFLKGGGDPNYRWHYVIPPVNNSPKSILTTDIDNDFNLVSYLETRVTTDKMAGWNWHDGYDGTPGFSILENTRGYNVYTYEDQTALFSGSILANANHIFANSQITYSGSDPLISGWNLVGNPFTSAVNADAFKWTGSGLERIIYFTKDHTYPAYNTVTRQGINGATNIVPPMQGFFVHANSSKQKALTIEATSRIYSINPRYKSTNQQVDYPIVKFNVSDNNGFTDESIIYFFTDATPAFDTLYDAYKLMSENPAVPQIYTISGTISLAMNGLPLPDNTSEVPVRLRIGESKNYSINILDLQNLNDYSVILVHGDNHVDLKTIPNYTFPASAGTISNISIIFRKSISSNIMTSSFDNVRCWYFNNLLTVIISEEGFEKGSAVTIHDMNGRLIRNWLSYSFPRGNAAEFPVDLPDGIYFLTVTNGHKRIYRKFPVSHS